MDSRSNWKPHNKSPITAHSASKTAASLLLGSSSRRRRSESARQRAAGRFQGRRISSELAASSCPVCCCFNWSTDISNKCVCVCVVGFARPLKCKCHCAKRSANKSEIGRPVFSLSVYFVLAPLSVRSQHTKARRKRQTRDSHLSSFRVRLRALIGAAHQLES